MRNNQSQYTIITLLLSSLAILIASNSSAQVKPYNEEITVVAAYDPIIPDAFKISKNPVITDTITRIPVMNYAITSRIADVKPFIEPLPA